MHFISFHFIALHCIALNFISFHCIALHCIALNEFHFIALHRIALHRCPSFPAIASDLGLALVLVLEVVFLNQHDDAHLSSMRSVYCGYSVSALSV
jgi:hypothetical protein